MRARVFSILFRMLASTWRFRVEGTAPQGPCILGFWHSSMTAVWKYFAHTGSVGVTSKSNDGDLLARLLHDWNYEVIRGSSSSGGAETLESMIVCARTRPVLLTPDGPRGPIHVAKPGAVVAAHRAGVPLVFCSVRISGSYIFKKSWDRFSLPLPFSRITLLFHAPMVFTPETSREDLESALREVNMLP